MQRSLNGEGKSGGPANSGDDARRCYGAVGLGGSGNGWVATRSTRGLGNRGVQRFEDLLFGAGFGGEALDDGIGQSGVLGFHTDGLWFLEGHE